jgi:tetratricopeptide (TPR) repeat protein
MKKPASSKNQKQPAHEVARPLPGKVDIKIPLLICVVIAFLVYANTIGHGYTVDDATVIAKNEITQKGVGALGEIFTTPYRAGFWDRDEGLYRPLSVAMFAIEHDLWPEEPMPGHVINILLFVLTTALVFITVRKLFPGDDILLPFITALLFAIHPIHTEVVANIKSRDEILCLLFGLLCISFLTDHVNEKKLKYLLLSMLMYFLSFLSKESAITLLAVFPLVVWFRTEKGKQLRWSPLIGLTAVATASMVIRYLVLGSMTGTAEHQLINNSLLAADGFPERLGSALTIMGKYLYLLIIPHPLSFDYSYNQIPLTGLFTLPALAALMICASLFYRAIKQLPKKGPDAFGILFFFITISLVSNILFLIESSMAERFLYMPSFGYCLGVSWALVRFTSNNKAHVGSLTGRIKSSPILAGILLVFLVSYGYKSISRNACWKDNITLLEQDVRTSPSSARIRYAYGSALLIEKAFQEDDPVRKSNYLAGSVEQLEKGVSILSTYSDAWYHLGLAYKELGNGTEAVRAFETARSQKTFDKPEFYIASGIAYGMTKDFDNAIADLRHASSLDPQNAEAFNNMGLYYSDKGVPDSSLIALNEAIRLNPEFPEAWYNKGNTLAQMQDFDGAIAAYTTAIGYRPEYTDAMLNIGNSHAALQRYEQALEWFHRVAEREPGNKKVMINLGITYRILGNEIKADEYLQKAEHL